MSTNRAALPPALSLDRGMALVLLVVVGQVADLITFMVVIATEVPGTEAGPLGRVLVTLGPVAVVVVKLLAISALGLGALALRHRGRVLALLVAVGFFGALMNTLAIATA
jgi:hypothetical protein